MPTEIHRRVERARRGEDPALIARMPSGWAVLGDAQFVEGYSLLLPDPVVPHLNALTGRSRSRFLADMTRLGDALLTVTGALRINYEMLGNVTPALHAHLFPRYDSEPEELRLRPVWFYDWDRSPRFDPLIHRPLIDRLVRALGL